MIVIDRNDIFRAIELERERQEQLHPIRLPNKGDEEEIKTMKHYLFLNEMLVVLMEEVGEVAKALQGDGDLEEELIQVASVCVRFLEHMK
jgi:NTP pyrophosphatase (non-canonical NTP hydrolase)